MHLNHRPTQSADLEVCFPLIRDRFLYNTKSARELLSLWRHWFKTRACNSSVVEDWDQPKGKRIVGFGLSFFPPESVARQLKESLPPYLPLRVLEKWRKRSRFFLDREGI
jgi:hypothetical protein